MTIHESLSHISSPIRRVLTQAPQPGIVLSFPRSSDALRTSLSFRNANAHRRLVVLSNTSGVTGDVFQRKFDDAGSGRRSTTNRNAGHVARLWDPRSLIETANLLWVDPDFPLQELRREFHLTYASRSDCSVDQGLEVGWDGH